MSDAKGMLEKIGSYKDNWNGLGASAYTPIFIKFVSDVIDILPVDPTVFPLADIGIQLMIPTQTEREIDITVNNDFTINCALLDGADEVKKKVNVSRNDLLRLVGAWISVKEPSEYPRL